MIPLSIPSPPLDWEILLELGPFKIRTYAVAILIGIFVAVWLTRRRWIARGGDVESMEEIAVWAIPFGIIGGRIYHVISTPGPYFGEGGHPLDAFKIWDGGLGIWGAVAIGSLGAYIGVKRSNVSFSAFMDAAAPAVLIAQAIGRIGNYFNQELFGKPTTMPWGLEISPQSIYFPHEYAVGTLFQPTFLYELLWNLAGAALLLYLDRRFRFRFGRMFWLYVVVYTSGRLWIEMLRIDTAVHIWGVRINVWVSIAVFLLGLTMFLALGWRHRGQTVMFPARTLAPADGKGDSAAKDASADKPDAKAATAAKPAVKKAVTTKETKKPVAKKAATSTGAVAKKESKSGKG